jgi:hypothetical protein
MIIEIRDPVTILTCFFFFLLLFFASSDGIRGQQVQEYGSHHLLATHTCGSFDLGNVFVS